MPALFQRLIFHAAALAAIAGLAACATEDADGYVDVAFIGSDEGLRESGLRIGSSAQHLRAATIQGLVALDAEGEVVPALAERWIVTDDGRSYIFRLRDVEDADGDRITAREVRNALVQARTRLAGTSLGFDLDRIEDIRAMAGRVVEIRLSSPMPDLLQLLAQPELGIALGGGGGAGTGPMQTTPHEWGIELTTLPPVRRGEPLSEEWEEEFRPLRVRAMSAPRAIEAFGRGELELVLDGQLAHLPLVDTGPLSRGTVRIDATIGLFGLAVATQRGFLGSPENREAVALAIDRETLLQPFNLAGWIPTTRIVPAAAWSNAAPHPERWAEVTAEQRRAIAARTVAAWEALNGEQVVLRLAMPAGPGSDILFAELAADLEAAGITGVRVRQGEEADLELVDRVARFGGPRWFLNQFHCRVRARLCSPDADVLVADASALQDERQRLALLAQAERELLARNAYIPLGAPIRWALVRGEVTGFAENRWAMHPLFPLARRPM